MGVVKKRVTLVTGPKIIEDVQKGHKPLLDEKNRLSQQDKQDQQLLNDVLKDPYADLPPHSSPSLMEIREWVRNRDETKEPIEKRVSERKKRIEEINAQLSPGQKRLREVEEQLEQRKQRLNKAKKKREQRVRFANNLADPDVMSEFIEVKSEHIRDLLSERGVKSSGWDEFDQQSAQNKKKEKESLGGRRRPWLQSQVPAPAFRASRLASIKTIAGVYGQLCRETEYKPEKSVLDGLERVFKAAKIRDVLEVGPGSRGVVCILQDLGLAEKLGLKLASIDLLDKPS
ncbi:MAG: hypothetical protein GF334_01660, partial [Candidatus Altiarchaeales archaeon]|nr:hypothetical protein [Candidatus Altiarchaeales archaeon]